jgi:hypothetical protein
MEQVKQAIEESTASLEKSKKWRGMRLATPRLVEEEKAKRQYRPKRRKMRR